MQGMEQLNAAEFLSKIVIIKDLSPDELLLLSEFMEIREYGEGINIFSEHDTGTELFIIISGEVEVVKNSELADKQELLGRMAEGDFFGEMAIVERELRCATVRTLIDTKLYVLSISALENLETEHPQVAIKIYKGFVKIVAARLRMRDEHYCFTKHTLESMRKFL